MTEFARDLAPLGPANFLYSDGEVLIAHGNRRTQEDGTIRPPGLHVLTRECQDADAAFVTEGLYLSANNARQRIVLFASVPLSTEPWRALDEGEVIACFDDEL